MKPLQTHVLGDGEVLGTLKRFGFSCCTDPEDTAFQMLEVVTRRLCDPDQTRSWNPEYCKTTLKKINDLFCRQEISQLRSLINLFDYLAAADKVWEFAIAHNEFVSPDEKGYNGLFNERVEDYLAQLGGEDHRILMNFQEVFQWVAIIAFNRTKSFSDLMDALSASPDIAGHASKPWEKQPFVELISAQKSMDQINELFTEGALTGNRIQGREETAQDVSFPR